VEQHEQVSQGLGQSTLGCNLFEIGEPLPTAVVAQARQRLSPQARQEIGRLMRPDPGRFLWQLVLAWVTIIGAVLLAEYSQRLWVTALAVIFIATRQNILALLMHEQCHRIGFRSRLGDYLGNFTCAYPILLSVEGYRRIHLAHHQCYFTDKDPDYRRKQGLIWTFPQEARRLLATILKDLLGLTFLAFFKGKRANLAPEPSRAIVTPAWVRLSYYAVVAGLLTWFHLWPVFLVYWILPLVTVLQVIVRWGAICEHKYNLIRPTVEESTPIIEPRWWEALLLPNLNFTLHIYHHWYPAIPYAKLPRVHELFRREGLVTEEHVFRGFWPYLKFLLSQPKAAPAEGSMPSGGGEAWSSWPDQPRGRPGRDNLDFHESGSSFV
jgi:fatty acid desaturase